MVATPGGKSDSTILPETRIKIRRSFFSEHWKVATIAAQLGLHTDTVRLAIESDMFRTGARDRRTVTAPFLLFC